MGVELSHRGKVHPKHTSLLPAGCSLYVRSGFTALAVQKGGRRTGRGYSSLSCVLPGVGCLYTEKMSPVNICQNDKPMTSLALSAAHQLDKSMPGT